MCRSKYVDFTRIVMDSVHNFLYTYTKDQGRLYLKYINICLTYNNINFCKGLKFCMAELILGGGSK